MSTAKAPAAPSDRICEKSLFTPVNCCMRALYDDRKSNSCRIIQLFHVFLKNAGDILAFLCVLLLLYFSVFRKKTKNCSIIHRYYMKNHGITGKYFHRLYKRTVN